MIPFEIPATSVDEVMRVVRALGTHRYVVGRLHLVHAFVFDAAAAASEAPPSLEGAIAWARGVLANPEVERGSKDERLWRRATEDEIALALEAFWRPGSRADRAHERLMDHLAPCGAPLAHDPFDAGAEDEIHPVLIDAGWELLPLAALDAERHRGAIAAFGEPIYFDAAKFEEESAYEPVKYLQELPALGAVELLRGADADGRLVAPLELWAEGNETYHDYVVRGVIRAAKLGS